MTGVSDPASTGALPAVVRSQELAQVGYLRLVRDTLHFPDGREFDRAVVEHPGAVALIVLDAAERWLLVRQYRHAARRYLLEIPAGTREAGEEPAATAAREVREETGFAAGRLEHLGGTFMAPGFCQEFIDYYLASELRPDPLPQDTDEGIAPPEPMTLDEVYAAVADGRIADAKTLVALTLFQRRRSRAGAAATP